ncbi:hypothetical protein ACJX0J_042479 [Zea mays]
MQGKWDGDQGIKLEIKEPYKVIAEDMLPLLVSDPDPFYQNKKRGPTLLVSCYFHGLQEKVTLFVKHIIIKLPSLLKSIKIGKRHDTKNTVIDIWSSGMILVLGVRGPNCFFVAISFVWFRHELTDSHSMSKALN